MLDPKNLAALNDLIAWTQAHVVVSSDWRHRLSLMEIRRTLKDQGFDGGVLDQTPTLPGAERWNEIQTWLDMTQYPIEGFVILDDSEMGPLAPYLVRIMHSTGLTSEQVEQAARILLA